MLLDNSDRSDGSGSGGGAGKTSPPRGRHAFWLILALLVIGVVLAGVVVGRRGPSQGGTQGPGIVPGAGGPPPSIFAVKPGTPTVPPVGKEWAQVANANYEYQFEYPTDWALSTPDEYTQGRARMLVSKTLPSVAIVVIPFGLYDQDESSEITKAENAYLGSHSLEQDTKETLEGRTVVKRSYMCTLPESGEMRKARAVYIVARPKCYALFLRGTDEEVGRATDVFDRVVKSFRLEKLPLRDAKDAPPPPSGSPGAAPPSPAAPLTPGVPSPPARVQTTPTPPGSSGTPSPVSASPTAPGPSGSPKPVVVTPTPPSDKPSASAPAAAGPSPTVPRIVLPKEPPPTAAPTAAPPTAAAPRPSPPRIVLPSQPPTEQKPSSPAATPSR